MCDHAVLPGGCDRSWSAWCMLAGEQQDWSAAQGKRNECRDGGGEIALLSLALWNAGGLGPVPLALSLTHSARSVCCMPPLWPSVMLCVTHDYSVITALNTPQTHRWWLWGRKHWLLFSLHCWPVRERSFIFWLHCVSFIIVKLVVGTI